MAPAVYNNPWGYAGFMPPVPNIHLQKDTLCPGEPLVIDLRRVLNDKSFWFEVCKVDSFWYNNTKGASYWKDTCIIDTIPADTIDPEVCRPPHQTPDVIYYYFKTTSLHRITIRITNDCGLNRDSIAYIFVQDTPSFSFDVPATACAGIGNVLATTSADFTGDYMWDVNILDTSGGMPFVCNKNQNNSITYHADFTGTLPDSFNFPGFNFLGGRKYLISLGVSNNCGTLRKYDTLDIPVGAYIVLERPKAYSLPVNGATQIQLHAYMSAADSFRWEPNTWLDSASSTTPISTPLDSITYVLIMHSGTCLASDTAHINYNRYANAGNNDTLCFDTTSVILGNAYDMSLLLGILYHYNPGEFKNTWYLPYTTTNPAYFRYFSHYMNSDIFKSFATSCSDGNGSNFYDNYTQKIQKDLFFKQPWFKPYYQKLILFTNFDMPALGDFETEVNSNTALRDNIDSIANWAQLQDCLSPIFTGYDEYLMNHMDEIHVSWDKISNGDTSTLTAWDEYFVAIEQPTQSTIYRVSVIAPLYAEIDEITCLVDTVLTPLFYPAIQWDSTIYFGNLTEPFSSSTSYEWNFGDGSAPIFETYPIHTFPAFDSNYVVCLSAGNHCNTWMYCDTVRIDSAHLGSGFSVIKKAAPHGSKTQNEMVPNKSIARSQQPIALSNYPNPFNNSTTIDYEIWQSFSSAELIISNTMGQQVFSQKLNRPIDKIQVQGSAFKEGLYYYSLLIDGTITETKIMSVMR